MKNYLFTQRVPLLSGLVFLGPPLFRLLLANIYDQWESNILLVNIRVPKVSLDDGVKQVIEWFHSLLKA